MCIPFCDVSCDAFIFYDMAVTNACNYFRYITATVNNWGLRVTTKITLTRLNRNSQPTACPKAPKRRLHRRRRESSPRRSPSRSQRKPHRRRTHQVPKKQSSRRHHHQSRYHPQRPQSRPRASNRPISARLICPIRRTPIQNRRWISLIIASATRCMRDDSLCIQFCRST